MILETSEERILLLKAGFTGKEIEKLYVELNSVLLLCPEVIV